MHRKVRSMTKLMDTCAEYPERLDTVVLIANLDNVTELLSEYRRALVTEAKETCPEKLSAYQHAVMQKALNQAGASLQAAFDANPDLLLRDNSKTFDGYVVEPRELEAK